jgi:hypothetical protein
LVHHNIHRGGSENEGIVDNQSEKEQQPNKPVSKKSTKRENELTITRVKGNIPIGWNRGN